jgi:ribosomal protein S18 acetylase RimI-like enzyme
MAVTLRPVAESDADRRFLLAVYTSTRLQELAVTDWSAEQVAAFCEMQFNAQAEHYRLHYPTAELSVIQRDGAPAGRLYVDRWSQEIRIMDIALLPEHRGCGIGTALLQVLQREAAAAGKKLSIHVERMNPALALYQRLGFQIAEDKGVYLLMEWQRALT